jgi:hypothetical protein
VDLQSVTIKLPNIFSFLNPSLKEKGIMQPSQNDGTAPAEHPIPANPDSDKKIMRSWKSFGGFAELQR